ncbi:MAG: hypothetical protein KBC95_01145 [Candidatus Peribacteraceae bacterium]|nr:hypothetical protein [Candidatus Peribacteraceae bacterium]
MPKDSPEIPKHQPAEHQDAPAAAEEPTDEQEKAIFYARRWISEQEYESALRMLSYMRVHKQPKLAEGARELVPLMLSDVETSNRRAYHGLEFSPTREKYVTRDRDASNAYKFDLIKGLNLSPEDTDEIAAATIDKLLDGLEASLTRRRSSFSSSRERGSADNYVIRICEITYFLPFADKTRLASAQARFRQLAPGMLRHLGNFEGEYCVQNLGNCLKINWWQEMKEDYAPKALDRLFAEFPSAPNYEKGSYVDRATNLQDRSQAEVTPERRRGALALLPVALGYTDGTAAKLAKAFGLEADEVRAIARDEAEAHMRREENAPLPDRSSWYLKHLVTHYGIRPGDVPALEKERDALATAIGGDQSNDQRAESAERFLQNGRGSGSAHLLPLALHAEILRSIESPDGGTLAQLLPAFKRKPETEQQLHQALELLFGSNPGHPEPELDLGRPGERALWRELASQTTLRPAADRALDSFLERHGLDPQDMRRHWLLASNERKDLLASGEITEEISVLNVQEKNAAAIAALDAALPGTARYFHQKWGMKMFSRYEPATLAETRTREDKRTQERPEKPRKRRKNLLVILASDDWNGAYARTSRTELIADTAKAQGYDIHFAEAGSKMGAVLALARCARDNGPIDAAIIGGHGSSNVLVFGQEQMGRMTTDDFKLSDDEDVRTKQAAKAAKLREYFAPDARVILDSCKVGDEKGLAETISRTLNVDTIGASNITTGIDGLDLTTGTVNFGHSSGNNGQPTMARYFRQPNPPRRTVWQRLKGLFGWNS